MLVVFGHWQRRWQHSADETRSSVLAAWQLNLGQIFPQMLRQVGRSQVGEHCGEQAMLVDPNRGHFRWCPALVKIAGQVQGEQYRDCLGLEFALTAESLYLKEL